MYKLKLIRREFVNVEDKFGYVEIDIPMQFKDLDDTFNEIAMLVEGTGKPVRVEIEMIKETDDAE